MERVFPLEGVHNFRRFGGYETRDGEMVVGNLFRSGQFSRSSDADRDFMRALGITVVADLRRPRERNLEPSHWPEEAGVRVIQSDQDDHEEPPHLQFLRKGDHSMEAVRGYMMSAYRRIPREAGNQAVFREGIRALASGEAEGGLLVHCAAGKDRTGIMCALILDDLGVPLDVVMEDYLLTNHAVDYDTIVPAVQARIAENSGQTMPEESIRTFLGVDADFLQEAFDTIGDRDAYLRDTLGISDDERAAIRERWLTR